MCAASLKDSVPPYNLEAEMATLGAILLDPDSVGTVTKLLMPDDFYSLQNQKIFKGILALDNESKRTDLITLTEQLKSTDELDKAGGPGYIASLSDTVPTSANIEYYVEIVKASSIRRKLLKIANTIIANSHDDTLENTDILEYAQRNIFELSDATQTSTFSTLKEVIMDTVNNIEMLYKNKGNLTGIPSGFEVLDEYTSGFHPSELTIIGARPSIGKTALALTMAANIAINQKKPVAFFSLEMPRMDLVKRILSMYSKVPLSQLRNGMLTSKNLLAINQASSVVYEAPLYIVDAPYMKLLDLRTLARQIRNQQKVEIIFIDYITLISNDSVKTMARHEQVAEISRALKGLARELQIPIVVLSQLKRESESSGGKGPSKPTLADLRESGSLEQDADVVLLLSRERDFDNKLEKIPTELTIAKQRNGPLGNIPLDFIGSLTKYESGQKQQQQ